MPLSPLRGKLISHKLGGPVESFRARIDGRPALYRILRRSPPDARLNCLLDHRTWAE